MPDAGAGNLGAAGCIDKSIENIGAGEFGGEDAVHPAETHRLEYGLCRTAARFGHAFGHRPICYSHRWQIDLVVRLG